jgi:hypothetical protein
MSLDRSDRESADATPQAPHVHVTFSFHCAFIRQPDKRRTDVLLSPGARHAMPSHTASEHGTAGGNGGSNGGTDAHQMEHIASLRVPDACIENREDHPGIMQFTTRLDREDADVTWRLEGYDVTLKAGVQLRKGEEPPANVGFTTAVGDVTYVVPDFARLAGLKVDPDCYADGDEFPRPLRKGARVRLNGGTLECGVPVGALKDRRWNVGSAENVGLSDRMEYRKELDESGTVELTFRKFDDKDGDETKTVTLKPDQNGVVRIHVSNDPFAHDPPLGSPEVDPCSALRHFASYSLLLYPAGEDKSARLRPPVARAADANGPLIVSEGNSACCPCGDGTP